MALDAVPGSPTANSYVTVADATLLLQERLLTQPWYTQPATASMTLVARREAALIWATQLLDAQIGWYGTPATTTQALAWPQTGQSDALGRAIPANVVPRQVQMATALTAVSLMALEQTVGTTAIEPGIKSKKIGDLTIVYQDDVRTSQGVAAVIPAEVLAMLRPYGLVPGLGMIPLLRV
jgi:hypothetical protein